MAKIRLAFRGYGVSDAVKLQRLRDKQLDEYLDGGYEENECDFEELDKLIDAKFIKQIIKEWGDIQKGEFSDELDQKLVKIMDVITDDLKDCDSEAIEEHIAGLLSEYVKNKKLIGEMTEFIMGG